MKTMYLFLLILAFGARFSTAQDATIFHALNVQVQPAQRHIDVTDSITFPADRLPDKWTFFLNSDLTVTSADPNVTVKLVQHNVRAQDAGMDMEAPEVANRIKQNKYVLQFKNPPSGQTTVVLTYTGVIYNEIKQLGQEYARGFSTSPGIVSEQGVYLAGSSDWIPWFNDQLITFRLTTRLPQEWDVVSQGRRTVHKTENGRRVTTWLCRAPMEEVFLIAAKFHEYNRPVGKVQVMAFLRSPDEALANKYLETTGQYLEMYRQLIGPYPFWKFALVENFWETGYGMPSFTLLGPQVIRFPFILHSSYPHELLHNWWGNSVYVDFSTGNWCEGLTVYMADHLIKEQRGQGAEYRRSTLQKFTDYVHPDNDFPLNKFLSRHDAPSEAIGYGKCMMMWDMLREDVGDQPFIQAVQKFYRDNKFKKASFNDLRAAFEAVSGKNFKPFFDQWVNRTGAPELQLADVQVQPRDGKYALTFTLKQIQDERPFDLSVPVAVSFPDEIKMEKVHLNQREQHFTFTYAERPAMVQVDPQFHVFRRLHYNEIPPALSKIFGSPRVLIVLPDESDAQSAAYRELAQIWSKDKTKDIEIKSAAQVRDLPADRAVWLFGRKNAFLRRVIEPALNDYDAKISAQTVQLGKTELPYRDNSFVVSVRHPKNPQMVAVWLTVGTSKAVAGLARKLPHYGKYSYLAFTGDEPTNIAKGQWPAVHSPLRKIIPLANGTMPSAFKQNLPKRPALAQLAPLFSARRMMQDIKYLSSDELQGRGLRSAGIEKAAAYIAQQFKKAGLQPGADDGSYFQSWQEIINAKGDKGTVKNVIGILPGTNPTFAGQAVVLSAHYDHLGLGWPDVHKGDEGKIHHGADDNASGVAVLLELARVLGPSFKPERTIIFVAFTAEESGLKGSEYFIRHYKRFPANKIMADINLDTVGRLNDKKVLILNGSSAKEWPFLFMGVGYVTGVQAEMVSQQLDGSDQVSFVRHGIPAVQIFSGAHRDYHRPTDTWDKIDANGLVKIATLTKEAMAYLAERKEPLTFTGKTGTRPAPAIGAKGQRKVSTGTMPDFSYNGQGVKIQSVRPGSPAQKAGLRAGDVITEFGGKPVRSLRDYSVLLKAHNPGDVVKVKFERNGKTHEAEMKLKAR